VSPSWPLLIFLCIGLNDTNLRLIILQLFSLSTYEVKLRQLGLRKKVSRDDWLPIWQHCQQIKQQGGEPVIFLNGTPLKWEKAWKEIRRNGAHKTAPRKSRLFVKLFSA